MYILRVYIKTNFNIENTGNNGNLLFIPTKNRRNPRHCRLPIIIGNLSLDNYYFNTIITHERRERFRIIN